MKNVQENPSSHFLMVVFTFREKAINTPEFSVLIVIGNLKLHFSAISYPVRMNDFENDR